MFIICLYMFRALCAHHQEVKIVLYSIWYHHTCRWPSRAQVVHWTDYTEMHGQQNIKIIIDVKFLGWDSVGYVNLLQGRDRWRAVVNTVIDVIVFVPCT